MLTKSVSPTWFFLLALGKVFGSCPSTLPVSGSISVTACDSKKETCVSSVRAAFEYAQRENDSSTNSVAFWNAAAMRLEMKTASDSAKAIEHLRKASQMGDAKFKDWLSQLSRK